MKEPLNKARLNVKFEPLDDDRHVLEIKASCSAECFVDRIENWQERIFDIIYNLKKWYENGKLISSSIFIFIKNLILAGTFFGKLSSIENRRRFLSHWNNELHNRNEFWL